MNATFPRTLAVCLALTGCAGGTDAGADPTDATDTDEQPTITLVWDLDLPELGVDSEYEGWLIVDGVPVSTGRFTVDATGVASAETYPATIDEMYDATAFVLTIEPAVDNDPGPSATKLLAGDFVDFLATATAGHVDALGTDFSTAMGGFILETPSTAELDDYAQGIWWLDPDGGPGPGLALPTLPDGWIYEGWTVGPDGPISTGTFSMVDAADSDGGGISAGPLDTPPFPGQDFIDPVHVLEGYAAVISVEPAPDDADTPFAIKPLIDGDIMDEGAGIFQTMERATDPLPMGDVWFDVEE